MNATDRQILEHRFRVCLEARNFEVTQLVARNNFFMIFQGVLLSGLVQVSDKASGAIAVCICVIGALTAAAQFCMASGAKFWQERWEVDLENAERALMEGVREGSTLDLPKLYSLDVKDAERMVTQRQEGKDRLPLFVHRFSVSQIPMWTAVLLLGGWIYLFCHAERFNHSDFPPLSIQGFRAPEPPASAAK